MKKNQVNAILVDQTKRRKKIFSYCACLLIISIIAFSFFVVYVQKNKNYFVTYKEESGIDYRVYLKENSFFEENYLGNDSKYIASLIDFISANFEYSISMSEKNVDYRYGYRMDAVVSVTEKNSTKPLYTKTNELLNVENQYADGSQNVEIIQNIDIDYNEYNDMIKSFISLYGLDDVQSTLTINMYVDVIGSCDEFQDDSNNTSVTSLSIPLTTKTMEIDIKNNIVEADDGVIICNEANSFTIIYLVLFITTLLFGMFILYKLIKYVVDTRTAENIYDFELKKILNNYHSYIQRVSNKIDLGHEHILQIDNQFIYKGCQFFRLEAFTDMLEIRDSINAPILMSSNSQNTATYFIILDVTNKAVYVYGLRINDIKNQMKNNAIKKGYIKSIEEEKKLFEQ